MNLASPLCTTSRSGSVLTVHLDGQWHLSHPQPDLTDVLAQLDTPGLTRVCFTTAPALEWDTSLLVLLVRVVERARPHNITVDKGGLPSGLHRLLDLAFAVPPKEGSAKVRSRQSFVSAVGQMVCNVPDVVQSRVAFFGDVVCAVGRLLCGKSDMRAKDLWAAMQECGFEALPIISLTNVLFGLILAFVGAVQLTQFGAQIYVAGLVGIGVVRVMGAIMVGVVMAGRMGASYAALIGTMQVNEEVDALATLGLSPTDFLVLPRVLALLLMIPFLTLYADLMGLIGGFVVGTCMLGVYPLEYITATCDMVPLSHLFIGLVYAMTFGVIVALCGCFQGIHCGRSAAAVGKATTAAVVSSLVGIIIATAVITIICNVLGV